LHFGDKLQIGSGRLIDAEFVSKKEEEIVCFVTTSFAINPFIADGGICAGCQFGL